MDLFLFAQHETYAYFKKWKTNKLKIGDFIYWFTINL